jgi:hypothetical protein
MHLPIPSSPFLGYLLFIHKLYAHYPSNIATSLRMGICARVIFVRQPCSPLFSTSGVLASEFLLMQVPSPSTLLAIVAIISWLGVTRAHVCSRDNLLPRDPPPLAIVTVTSWLPVTRAHVPSRDDSLPRVHSLARA